MRRVNKFNQIKLNVQSNGFVFILPVFAIIIILLLLAVIVVLTVVFLLWSLLLLLLLLLTYFSHYSDFLAFWLLSTYIYILDCEGIQYNMIDTTSFMLGNLPLIFLPKKQEDFISNTRKHTGKTNTRQS